MYSRQAHRKVGATPANYPEAKSSTFSEAVFSEDYNFSRLIFTSTLKFVSIVDGKALGNNLFVANNWAFPMPNVQTATCQRHMDYAFLDALLYNIPQTIVSIGKIGRKYGRRVTYSDTVGLIRNNRGQYEMAVISYPDKSTGAPYIESVEARALIELMLYLTSNSYAYTHEYLSDRLSGITTIDELAREFTELIAKMKIVDVQSHNYRVLDDSYVNGGIVFNLNRYDITVQSGRQLHSINAMQPVLPSIMGRLALDSIDPAGRYTLKPTSVQLVKSELPSNIVRAAFQHARSAIDAQRQIGWLEDDLQGLVDMSPFVAKFTFEFEGIQLSQANTFISSKFDVASVYVNAYLQIFTFIKAAISRGFYPQNIAPDCVVLSVDIDGNYSAKLHSLDDESNRGGFATASTWKPFGALIDMLNSGASAAQILRNQLPNPKHNDEQNMRNLFVASSLMKIVNELKIDVNSIDLNIVKKFRDDTQHAYLVRNLSEIMSEREIFSEEFNDVFETFIDYWEADDINMPSIDRCIELLAGLAQKYQYRPIRLVRD